MQNYEEIFGGHLSVLGQKNAFWVNLLKQI